MKNVKLINQNRFEEILNSFSDLDPIAVYGDVGIDKYTMGRVDRISPEAPVPVLLVEKQWKQLGLAANITNNLNELGVSNYLFSAVGDDHAKDEFFDLLSKKSAANDTCVVDKDLTTICKERITTSGQQICRVDYEKVQELSGITSKLLVDSFSNYAESVSSLIIEDYSKGMVNETICKKLITKAKDHKKMVLVDPGKKTDPKVFSGVDLFKPNLHEAKMIVESFSYFGEESIENYGQIILEKLKLKYLVITLGPKGMAIFDSVNNESFIIPTVAPEVFDVSGAGDTAISVLASSLCAGASLTEAAWMSNCASGVVVGKLGTATVNCDELRQFYKKLSCVYE